MVGNPPWVNVQWSETDAVSDANPYFAIHKLTASDLSKRMGELLKNSRIRTMYLREYVNIAGALAFYGSAGNYPLLQGRTNLFRCFLPNAWSYTRAQNGVSAFVHPDEVYADTKAPLLRREMYRRICSHFHFQNRLNLFAGVDSNAQFSLNIYRNKINSSISFDSIWNLYAPSTIDECYASDGSGDVPGTKDDNWNWEVKGHKNRIIHIEESELKTFALLLSEQGTSSWRNTPLVAVHAQELLMQFVKWQVYLVAYVIMGKT